MTNEDMDRELEAVLRGSAVGWEVVARVEDALYDLFDEWAKVMLARAAADVAATTGPEDRYRRGLAEGCEITASQLRETIAVWRQHPLRAERAKRAGQRHELD